MTGEKFGPKFCLSSSSALVRFPSPALFANRKKNLPFSLPSFSASTPGIPGKKTAGFRPKNIPAAAGKRRGAKVLYQVSPLFADGNFLPLPFDADAKSGSGEKYSSSPPKNYNGEWVLCSKFRPVGINGQVSPAKALAVPKFIFHSNFVGKLHSGGGFPARQLTYFRHTFRLSPLPPHSLACAC